MAYLISRSFFTGFFLIFCAIPVAAQKYVSPDDVKSTIITADELKTLVRSTEKKQPVLINFWATWCGPCRVEFPDLVRLDKEYREQGLRIVVVSIDTLSLVDTAVSDFLKSYQAEMPSYLLDLASSRAFPKAIRRIAPNARAGLPLTLLYDKNGKLVYQKNGVIDAAILRIKIEKLLKK